MTTTNVSTPVDATISNTNWLVVNAPDAVTAQNKATQLSVGTLASNSGKTFTAHVADVTQFFTGTTSLYADADPGSRAITVEDITGFSAGSTLAIVEGEYLNDYGSRYTTDGYITENIKINAVGTTATSASADFFPYVLGTVTNGATGIGNVYYPPLLSSAQPNLVKAGQSISGTGILPGVTIASDYTDTSAWSGGANNTIAVTASGTSAGTSLTFASVPSGVVTGLSISGTGVAPGTVITAISGTTVTINRGLTANISSGSLIVSGYVMNASASLSTGATQDGVILALGGSSSSSLQTVPITSITTTTSATSTYVTITTASAHGFLTNDSIVIAGLSPSGYNGTFTVTVSNTTTFSYTVTGSLTSPSATSATATKSVSYGISSISATAISATPSFVAQSAVGDSIDFVFDADEGQFFSVDNVNQKIWKTTSGGAVSTYLSGYSVRGLAYLNENLYFSDGVNTVYKVNEDYTQTSITNIAPSQNATLSTSTFASGFGSTGTSNPNGVAFDSSGNLYTITMNIVSVSGTSVAQLVLSKVNSSGSVASTYTYNFANTSHFCYDLAIDSSNNIYVTCNDGNIYITNTSFTSFALFTSSAPNSQGICYDSYSNSLYATNSTGTSLYKISLAGTVSTFGTVLSGGVGVVTDFNGNVYTTSSNGQITKITPAGVSTIWVTYAANPYSGSGIAVDTAGTVYVVDNSRHVYTINSSGTTTLLTTLSGTGSPGALALYGNALYTPSNGTNLITKIAIVYNLATVTTASAHGLTTGTTVTVASNSVSTYNGSWIITVTGSTTFTYLTPTYGSSTGTGGTVAVGSLSATSFATGLNQPTYLAWDNAGANLYISNAGNNSVMTVSSSGGTATNFCSSGINQPGPLQWDSSGTYLYLLSLSGNGPVYRINTSGIATTWASTSVAGIGNTFIVGLAIDTSGTNVYVLDQNGNVLQIPISTGIASLFTTTYNALASSIKTGSSGNLYITFRQYPTTPFAILKLAIGSSNVVTVTTSSNNVFSTGQTVTIAGVSPTTYNGSFSVTALSATQFTYTLGSLPSSATLSSATASGSSVASISAVSSSSASTTYLATATTATNNFTSGSTAYISGSSVSGYNGNHSITVLSPTSFTFPVLSALSSSSGGYASVATVAVTVAGTSGSASPIASITGSAGTATVTTSSSNSFVVGQSVTVSGNSATTSSGSTTIPVGSISGGYNGTTPTAGVATLTTGVSFTGVATSGSTTISNVPSTTGLQVGNTLSGSHLASNATIASITAPSGSTPGSITMSVAATSSTTSGSTNTFVALQPASFGVGSVINVTSGGVSFGINYVEGNVPPLTGSALVTTSTSFGKQLLTGSQVSISGIPELSGTISTATATAGTNGLVTVTTASPHGLVSNDTVTTSIVGLTGAISQITGNGTVATVTTATPHGLSSGNAVTIAGIDGNSQSGTVTETVTSGNSVLIYLNSTPSPSLAVGDSVTIAGQTGANSVNGSYSINSVGAGTAGSVLTVTKSGGSTTLPSGNVNYVSQTGNPQGVFVSTTYSLTNLSSLTTWQGYSISSSNPATLVVTAPSSQGNISSIVESGGVVTVTTQNPHGLTATQSFATPTGTQTLAQTVNISVPSGSGSLSSISSTGTTVTAITASAHSIATGDTVTVSGVNTSGTLVNLATQNPTSALGITGQVNFSGNAHVVSSITNGTTSSTYNNITVVVTVGFSPAPNPGETFVISSSVTTYGGKTATVTSVSSNGLTIYATVTGVTAHHAYTGTSGWTITPNRVTVNTNQALPSTWGAGSAQYVTIQGANVAAYNVTDFQCYVMTSTSLYFAGTNQGNNTGTVTVLASPLSGGTPPSSNPPYRTPAYANSTSSITFDSYPTPHGLSSGQTVSVSGLQVWNQTVGAGVQGPLYISSIAGDGVSSCTAHCAGYHGLAVGSVITIAGSYTINPVNGSLGQVTVTSVPSQSSFTFNYAGGPSDSNPAGNESIIGYNGTSGFNSPSLTVASVIDSFTFTTNNPNGVQTIPSGQVPTVSVPTQQVEYDISFIDGSGLLGPSNPFNGTFTVTYAIEGTNSFQYTIPTSISASATNGTWTQPSVFSSLNGMALTSASGNTFTFSAPTGVSGTGAKFYQLGTWSQPSGFGGNVSYTANGSTNTDGSTTFTTATQAYGTVFGGTWVEGGGGSVTNVQSGVTWAQPTGFNQTTPVAVTVTSPTTFTYPLTTSTSVGTIITNGNFGTWSAPGNFGATNVPITVTGASTFTYTTNISVAGSISGGTWTTPVGFNVSNASITVPTYNITSISAPSSGVSTVTISGTHYFAGGESILITGSSGSGYNNSFTVATATPGTSTFTIAVSSGSSATGGVVTSQSSFYYPSNVLGTSYGSTNSLVATGSAGSFTTNNASVIAVYGGGTQFAFNNSGTGTVYGGTVSGTSGYNGTNKITSIISPTSFTYTYTSGVVGSGAGGSATTTASGGSTTTSLYSIVPTPQNVGLNDFASVLLATHADAPMSALQELLPDFIMGDATGITYNSATGVTTVTLMAPTSGFTVGQSVIAENGSTLGVINSVVSPSVFTTTGSSGFTFTGSSAQPTYLVHSATIDGMNPVYVGPTAGGNFYKAQFVNPPYHGNLSQTFTGTAGVDSNGNGQLTSLSPADAMSLVSSITVGQPVSGEGLADNTVVTSVGATSVGLSTAPFYTPSSSVLTTGATSPINNTVINVTSVSGFYEGCELIGIGIPAETVALSVSQQIGFTGTVTSGSPFITSVSSVSGLFIGQAIGGVTGLGALPFASPTYIVNINNATNTITVNTNALASQSSCSLWGLPLIQTSSTTNCPSSTPISRKVVYTFGSSPIYFPLQIANYGGSANATFSGTTTSTSNVISGISDTSFLYEGMIVTGNGLTTNSVITEVGTDFIALSRSAVSSNSNVTYLAVPPQTRLATFASMSTPPSSTAVSYSTPIQLVSQKTPSGTYYGLVKGSTNIVVNASTANALLAYAMPSGGYPLTPIAGLVASGTTITAIKPNLIITGVSATTAEYIQVNNLTSLMTQEGYTLVLNQPLLGNVASGVNSLTIPAFAISSSSSSVGLVFTVDSTANFVANQLISFRNEIYQIVAILNDTQMVVGYPLPSGGAIVPSNQYVSHFTGVTTQGSNSISVTDSVAGIVPGMVVNDPTNSIFPSGSVVTGIYTSGNLAVTLSQPASQSATSQFYISYPNGDNANYIYAWEGGITNNSFISASLSTVPNQKSSGWGLVAVDNATAFDHASGTMVGSYPNDGVRYFGTTSAGDYEAVAIDALGSLTGAVLQSSVNAKDTQLTIAPNSSQNTTPGSGFVPLFPSFPGVLAPVFSTTLWSDLKGSPAVISVPNGLATPTLGVLSVGTSVSSPTSFQASTTSGSATVSFQNYVDAEKVSNGMYVYGNGIPASAQVYNLSINESSGIATFQMIVGGAPASIDASTTVLSNATQSAVSTITVSWLPADTFITTEIESSFIGSFNISSPNQITLSSNVASLVPGLGVWGNGVMSGTTITNVTNSAGTYTVTLSMPLTLSGSVSNASFQVQGYLLNNASSYVPWSGTGALSSGVFTITATGKNNLGNTVGSLPTVGAPFYGSSVPYGATVSVFTNTSGQTWTLTGGSVSSISVASGNFVAGINLVASNLLQVTQPALNPSSGTPLSSVAIGAIGITQESPIAGFLNNQSSLSELGNVNAIQYNNDGDVQNIILDTPYSGAYAISGIFYSDAYGVVIVGSGSNQEAVLLESPLSYSFVAPNSSASSPITWQLATGSSFVYDHPVGDKVVIPNVLTTRSGA